MPISDSKLDQLRSLPKDSYHFRGREKSRSNVMNGYMQSIINKINNENKQTTETKQPTHPEKHTPRTQKTARDQNDNSIERDGKRH